jgi:hypothetical protein
MCKMFEVGWLRHGNTTRLLTQLAGPQREPESLTAKSGQPDGCFRTPPRPLSKPRTLGVRANRRKSLPYLP